MRRVENEPFLQCVRTHVRNQSIWNWPTRSGVHIISFFFLLLFTILFWNEFLVYFVKIGLTCAWPKGDDDALRIFIIADTHLLGHFRGHWLDKIRREWQMYRSYQSARSILEPHTAFFLGDLFDEGEWSDETLLAEYADRFDSLFGGPEGKVTPTVVLPGNHDLGFHYVMDPHRVRWFNRRYAQEIVDVVSIGKRPFILITSMALHGDVCRLCAEAENRLKMIEQSRHCAETRNISSPCLSALKSVPWPEDALSPVLMQHFPLFRSNEVDCLDVSHDDPDRLTEYRPLWDSISNESTYRLIDSIRPIVAFNGHSHRPCTKRWNRSGQPHFTEYTVNSFSWRNGPSPTLLLVSLSTKDSNTEPEVTVCYLPNEHLVIFLYTLTVLIFLIYLFLYLKRLFHLRYVSEIKSK